MGDPERPIDVVVECFSSDEEIRRLAQYDDEFAATLAATWRLAPDCRRARISHHLAHVYSVFHPSPFREAAVVIVDGQSSGSPDWAQVLACARDRRVERITRNVLNRLHCT